MDAFEKRLRDDAAAIDGSVPDALRARIDATVGQTEPQRAAPSRPVRGRLLAGAAACALLALLFVNTNRETVDETPVVTAMVDTPPTARPLPIGEVELTEPLQQELSNLRADLERARASIERDLRRTL